MKLSRRHLEQALVLALDDLAEQQIALAELGDRWQLIHDLLDKERQAHRDTSSRLDEVRSELGDLMAFGVHRDADVSQPAGPVVVGETTDGRPIIQGGDL